MSDTQSRIDPADEREFEQALGANGTAHDATDEVPELSSRFLAALIDGVMAMVVSFVPLIGGIAAAAYMLCRDGLELEFADGRSVGKKVMNIRPVRLDGQPMDVPTSIKRNWMFGFGALVSVLLFIPIIGWLLIIPVSLIAMGFGIAEVIKVVTDGQQRRFGDHWSGTRVVKAKK